ncbi:glycosyltransferase family 4 protein [Spirilliplanes yamanashiensis]|nr:glycosyltransferase family 1 protein [Spirilliplanes yamanashiensis]
MRIALVTESFPPDVNGVANSVVRVAEHLVARGHDPVVVAPATRGAAPELPYPVVRLPSVPMPGYAAFRLGVPTRQLTATLRTVDVVHLASPFVLGAGGLSAARSLGVPSVAVYQTDVPSYARLYRIGTEQAAWRWLRRIHNLAGRTLAPSSASVAALRGHGVQRVHLWRRGVDAGRFHPARRSAGIRRALAPGGETLVGYVGRLAHEKHVELLAGACALPGVRVVVVGDGPAAPALRRQLPGAVFLGARHGAQLARIYASLDVFAHPGPYETFGQSVQEALASGVPVVAPAAGGPVDLVRPGATGLLVPPLDGGALTAAVAELAADPVRRARFGAAARADVAARSWAAVGDELLGHYAAVTAFAALPAAVAA